MDHIGSLLIGIGIVCAAFEGDIAPPDLLRRRSDVLFALTANGSLAA
jgi:hypothetical protein